MAASAFRSTNETFSSLLDSRKGQYSLAIGIAIILPVIRFVLNRVVFKPLALAVLPEDLKSALTEAELKDRLRKWNEAAWKATYRVLVVSVAYTVCTGEDFLFKPHNFWAGCTQFPPCNFPSISRGLRLTFALELAFYLDAIPYLLFFEVRRKGFLADFVHHLVTLGLIFYSSQLNFLKVGVAIILCHEINDILMESAKMWRYLGYSLVPHVLFAAFALSWVATRLVYFPIFVIWNIYIEPPKLAIKYGVELYPHRNIFLALLSTLLVLHIYWSFLIFKIVYNTVSGAAELDDIREKPTTQSSSSSKKDS